MKARISTYQNRIDEIEVENQYMIGDMAYLQNALAKNKEEITNILKELILMLDELQIRDLVTDHGPTVNHGRPIKQIIEDGDIPRLNGATVLEGKVSDSVFAENLTTKAGQPIRLMYRNNRISTHDVNLGAIPFKDQVLACLLYTSYAADE